MAEVEIDGVKIEPPSPIKWYPNKLGWQLNTSRATLRKNPVLKQFHQFLLTETDQGNISRQEAVSMIPPFFLDIQPHHKVLDMCAAPGSKTAQLLEMLHENSSKENPLTGFVVANDADVKRCYLLVHQLHRLCTLFPNVIVTNHDGLQFPNLYMLQKEGQPQLDKHERCIKFDRILCDVMCSGDGTFRKAPDMWKKWSPMLGLNLHKFQVNITMRAVSMLKTGGLMVYSTCSINPLEDEAVVAEILRRSNGCMELVDVSDKFPELKRHNGITKWRVMDKVTNWYTQFEEVKNVVRKSNKIQRSMFPPTPEEIEKFKLERSMRILPHTNNSGGFFIAVFRKVADFEFPTAAMATEEEAANTENNAEQGDSTTAETSATTETEGTDAATEEAENDEELEYDPDNVPIGLGKVKVYRGRSTSAEEGFIPCNPHNLEVIKKFYNLDEGQGFRYEQLLSRCIPGSSVDNAKRIVYVSKSVHEVLQANTESNKWRIVNAGLRVFERNDTSFIEGDHYRISQEGLPILLPYFQGVDFEKRVFNHDRVVVMNREDFLKFLTSISVTVESFENPDIKERLAKLGHGGFVVVLDPNTFDSKSLGYEPDVIAISGIRTVHAINRLIKKNEVNSILYRVAIFDPTFDVTNWVKRAESVGDDSKVSQNEDVVKVTE